MPTITPTVGRVVWFRPSSNSTHHGFAPGAICAAMIAAVLDDGTLNLGVLDSKGQLHAMEKVPLIQDGDPAPENGYYAQWMPFQLGQAGKTEAVIKAAAESRSASPFSEAANPAS